MIQFLLPSKAATVQTLGHPAAGIIGWFDESSNVSGQSVTRDTALTFAAVWCATRVIAETVGMLPCVLYRRTSDDSRERATDDSRYGLVHDEPHPLMNAVNFFESQTAAVVLTGNCYSEIVFDGAGTPIRFEPRTPENVTPRATGEQLVYEIADPRELVLPDYMLHVPGLGGDGLKGWSVVTYAAQSIGSGMAADQYAAGQFGSGATPNGALELPTRLDKPAREQLRREWNEIHQGAQKAGRIAILHGGMKFSPVSMSNDDAQFLESRQFSIREIARWFRLPPHMLADLSDSSVRANIEQQAIEFITYSMAPWLVRWQQTLNRKLLRPDERGDLYYEFLTDALLRGDTNARYQAYATARQWGWLSVNDIRRRENMNTIDGGDTYLQPGNMVPAGANTQVRPQAIEEMQSNFQESIRAILDNSRTLRQTLELGNTSILDAIADADLAAAERLAELRERQVDIRAALEPARTQVTSLGDERTALIDSCNSLLRFKLAALLKTEKAEAVKAARCVARGQNFIDWLTDFYSDRKAKIEQQTAELVAVYGRLDQPRDDWVWQYCGSHLNDLLNAADGDREGFVARVQAAVNAWDSELETITL